MSGICGIVRLDGGPASEQELTPIVERLKQRGPDAQRTWAQGSAALGHALLATTAEAVSESLPLTHAESGCTITADVRLDSREELSRKLGTEAGRTLGDGELILLAYLKWGESCVDQLRGDFAFAIWDAREQRLFGARDQMGMRQLTYCHLPGRAFLFATEPAALVAQPLVPKALNEGRMADFMDRLEAQNLTETLFAAVYRLPPAHVLTVDRRGLTIAKYWQLAAPPQRTLKSDEDYVAAFLDVFGQSVSDRLRAAGGVGAMLSGGLDSGAAASVAADLLAKAGRGPLKTFSVVGPDSATCRETRAILESTRIAGIDPQLICYADLAEYRDQLRQLIEQQSDPFDWQMAMIRAIYLAAHRAGVKVVLDGVASDLVFSSSGNVGGLLRDGRLLSAWREARGEGRFWSSRAEGWRSLSRAAWNVWAPSPVRNARRRLAWWSKDRRIGSDCLIDKAFAQRASLRRRRQQVRDRDADRDHAGADARGHSIAQPQLVAARERYDRVAAAVAVEPRDPFMDLRVIDFCLSLPPAQLQSRGWPKLILRRAMAGKLPDQVRWRRGRDHLGSTFTNLLFSEWHGVAATPEVQQSLGGIANPGYLARKSLNPAAPQDCQSAIEAICFHQWLKSQAWEFEP